MKLVSQDVADAEVLTRYWTEARRRFDQTRVDFRRFDSLAALVARMHRQQCQIRSSRLPFAMRRAA
jgi:hypothetical protein